MGTGDVQSGRAAGSWRTIKYGGNDLRKYLTETMSAGVVGNDKCTNLEGSSGLVLSPRWVMTSLNSRLGYNSLDAPRPVAMG